MPLTVKKLLANVSTAEIAISGQDEKLHVTYRVGVLTPKLEAELRKYGDRSAGWADLISRLVVEWDLQADGGKPYPLEFVPESIERIEKPGQNGKPLVEETIIPASGALMELPGTFLAEVARGIREDLRPDPTNGAPSDGSS